MAARRALEWIKRQRPVWFLDMKYQTWFNKPGNPRVCHLQFQHGGRAGKSCLVQWCTSTLGWHVEEWHILSYTHYQGVFDPHVCEHATNWKPGQVFNSDWVVGIGGVTWFRKLSHSSIRLFDVQVHHGTWQVHQVFPHARTANKDGLYVASKDGLYVASKDGLYVANKDGLQGFSESL